MPGQRVQSLAGGLRGQREEDRVGEPSEHQEPAGLPEQPAERQLVERVEDEGSWKMGARAEQDEEKCRGRGGDAKTRPAGRHPDCSWEPGQRQKAEGRYGQEEFQDQERELIVGAGVRVVFRELPAPVVVQPEPVGKGGAALGPGPARLIGER